MTTPLKNRMLAEPIPLTAKGEVVGHNGTVHVAVPVGSDDTVLTADSSEVGGMKFGLGAEPALPIASVLPFAGSTPPSGWLLCNGAAVSRTTYADLFAAVGTTYGVGDGSTTFNLPDLRGRMVLGDCDVQGSEQWNVILVYESTDTLRIQTPDYVYPARGTKVRYLADGGPAIGGLVSNAEYYLGTVAPASHVAYVKLAETRDEAMEGDYIDLTGELPAGTHTLTYWLTDRQLGDRAGEEGHTLAQDENAKHNHAARNAIDFDGNAGGSTASSDTEAAEYGGWTEHPNLLPFGVCHWMIFSNVA